MEEIPQQTNGIGKLELEAIELDDRLEDEELR